MTTQEARAFTPAATTLPEAMRELPLLLGAAGIAGEEAEWLSEKLRRFRRQGSTW